MKVFEGVGKRTVGAFEYTGGVAELTVESLGFIGTLRVRTKETLAQAYFLGVQSLPIVLLTALFTGMVISLESAAQSSHYGVTTLVGGAVAYVTSRELGPMLSAVVVAGRAGAAMAAELGSMVVTEQIEALEALGLSPTRMLVVPRLVALVVMMPLLAILSDVVAIVGGMYIAQITADISYGSFIDSARIYSHFEDYLKGMFKAAIFGAIIVLIGCFQGFKTRGGAAGVGKSTTGSVVVGIILIFVVNFILSFLLFGAHAG
jgi:phospholipid/cholesterol/gamma-HCH transport system permease protein